MSTLADLLEAHQEQLMSQWVETVRRDPEVPAAVADIELENSLPDFLRKMIERLRAGPPPQSDPRRSDVAREHGKQRYRLGFQLEQLVREYGVLRWLIFELIERSGPTITLSEMRGLSDFIATGIADGVRQYVEERDADLRAESEGQRRRFEKLFIAAPSMMALLRGPELVFEFANTAYQQLVGVERHLLGKPLREALPEIPAQGLVEAARRVYETGEAHHENERQVWLKDESGGQKETILNFLLQPFRGADGRIEGVLIHAVEVTEEVRARRAEHAAREQAERDAAELAAIVQAIPDAIYVGDVTGVKYANRRAFELLGYPTLDTLNRNIETLWQELQIRDPATGQPIPLDALTYTRALKGETSSAEVLVRHRRLGQDIVVHCSGAPVKQGEKIIGAVVINSDISDRIRLEAEREKRASFEKQLIGIVSHDLTNPVGAIMLASQVLLKQPGLDEKVRKKVARIHQTAARAARLIDDLLDFTQARLGSGIPVKPKATDFHALVRHAVEDVQLVHPQRRIALEQLADGMGEWDPDRLTQIVSNLLGNALQYSPPSTPVTVRTRSEGDEVVLEVNNRGAQIPDVMLPSLFEPMKRGNHRETAQRSVGLGLYIVDQIVRAHRGEITVQSSAEEGTTFRVRLPRHFSSARPRG